MKKKWENGRNPQNKVIYLDINGDGNPYPKFEVHESVEIDFEDFRNKNFNTPASNKFLENTNMTSEEIDVKFGEGAYDSFLDGESPEGYTWHHNEVPGIMELVEAEEYDCFQHTGGGAIWTDNGEGLDRIKIVDIEGNSKWSIV